MQRTHPSPIVSIAHVSKNYANGLTALSDVSLDIFRGEVFALLGPNGAGKTTLINTICGAVSLESGTITIDGYDIIRDWRAARSRIGLVPQEINLEIFTPVQRALAYQRGFFGKPHNDALIESTLKRLSLWEKRDARIMMLSGGMKRRVLIAKALMNEPRVLFLDEPTAGVDVELRRDMWDIVRTLRDSGTTIILTTHYIEEAETLADRIGIIANGKITTVDYKDALMKRLGTKTLTITLAHPLDELPEALHNLGITHHPENPAIVTVTYNLHAAEATPINDIFAAIHSTGVPIADVATTQTSLEDIFVNLVTPQKS